MNTTSKRELTKRMRRHTQNEKTESEEIEDNPGTLAVTDPFISNAQKLTTIFKLY